MSVSTLPRQGEPIEPSTNSSRFCDLVMKGGITSGVVYPLAAAKLAARFVFKNVGGTSAGAIAAAATAAAELARDQDGFQRLKELPNFLSGPAPDKNGSNLFAFFQPQPSTARLFRIGVAGLGGGGAAVTRVLWSSLQVYPLPALLGALLPLGFLTNAFLNAHGFFLFLCIALGGLTLLLGLALGVGMGVTMDALKVLPANFYGLCTGMTDDFAGAQSDNASATVKRGKPLTFWLTEYLGPPPTLR